MFNTKAIVAAIIVVLAIIGGTWVYLDHHRAPAPVVPTVKAPTQTIVEQAEADNVQNFSMNARVTKISGKKITVSTGSVQPTPQGNKFVAMTEVFDVTSDTTFTASNPKTKAALSLIKVGTALIIFTNQDPFKQSEVTATKIMIQN